MLRSSPPNSQPAPIRVEAQERARVGNPLQGGASTRDRRMRVARVSVPNPIEAGVVTPTNPSQHGSYKMNGHERATLTQINGKSASQGQPGPLPLLQETAKRRAMAPAAAGFILADKNGNPLYASQEARAILTYPKDSRNFLPAWTSLQKAIFPLSGNQELSAGYSSRAETMSGRRRYVCLAIPLDKSRAERMIGGTVAIVLERHREASALAKTTSEHFRLTEREQEVVEFLIRGLTNKEIATRMQISPNTVRAFVRMVMGKLGISTRSGIVGMVFREIHNLPSWDSEQNRFRKS